MHYLFVPNPVEKLICRDTEGSVNVMQRVVELGRYLRDNVNSPVKYPLPEVVVIHRDQKILDDVLRLETYIREELNVKEVTVSTDKAKYGVALTANINFKALGARLKGDVKKVQQKVTELTDEEIQKMLESGSIDILGHTIDACDLKVGYSFTGEKAAELSSQYEAHADNMVLILLDVTPSPDMLNEGLAREVISRIQKLRKKANLVPTDEVSVWYHVQEDTELANVLTSYSQFIENSIKTSCRPMSEKDGSPLLLEESFKIKDNQLILALTKGFSQRSKKVDNSQAQMVETGTDSICCSGDKLKN